MEDGDGGDEERNRQIKIANLLFCKAKSLRLIKQ